MENPPPRGLNRGPFFARPTLPRLRPLLIYVRQNQQVELAKTGDAEKRMLIVEWGLKVMAENAHGLAADLVTS